MYNFSDEELTVIGSYPKEAYAYACKTMTSAIHQGQKINAPFKWFVSVCESYIKKNQTTSTGKQFSYTRPSTGPQAIFQPEQRQQESDYEFAANVENVLHRRNLAGEMHRNAGNYPNPKLKLLTQTEQDDIMAVHVECSCRQTVDDSLVIIQPAPVTKRDASATRHDFNWNDMIMKTPTVDKMSTDEIINAEPMCSQCGLRPNWKKGICAACIPADFVCTESTINRHILNSTDEVKNDIITPINETPYFGDEESIWEEL